MGSRAATHAPGVSNEPPVVGNSRGKCLWVVWWSCTLALAKSAPAPGPLPVGVRTTGTLLAVSSSRRRFAHGDLLYPRPLLWCYPGERACIISHHAKEAPMHGANRGTLFRLMYSINSRPESDLVFGQPKVRPPRKAWPGYFSWTHFCAPCSVTWV